MIHKLQQVWIGLGSNLDEPLQQLRTAITALRTLPGSHLEAVSSFYRSVPLGPAGQPDYLNAAARLRTPLDALTLLRTLQTIEHRQGRRRQQRWGARTLDLDILLYGTQRYHTPDLVIPHPQLTQRAFVLYPLHELEPGLVIPGHGAIRALLPAVAKRVAAPLPREHADDLACQHLC